jgi:hypothetical protein
VRFSSTSTTTCRYVAGGAPAALHGPDAPTTVDADDVAADDVAADDVVSDDVASEDVAGAAPLVSVEVAEGGVVTAGGSDGGVGDAFGSALQPASAPAASSAHSATGAMRRVP